MVSKCSIGQAFDNHNQFDAFKAHIQSMFPEKYHNFGWYALKECDDFYTFNYCEHGYQPSKNYLKELKKEGYTLAYQIEND